MRVVGLMSGTSMDGVDAVLLEVEAGPDAIERLRTGERPGHARVEWEVEAFVSRPYDEERRALLRDAVEGRDQGATGRPGTAAAELCHLHQALGTWHAEAVEELCHHADVDMEEIDLVGSHGHTVWHDPPDRGREGASLQLGSPSVLAERTGIPVVADFRSADLAAGGHGAPLVPFADDLLLSAEERGRALQNLGGMANVTHLPPKDSDQGAFAFDTGPGVALLDVAAELATGGRHRFDRDGELARRGAADHDLVDRLVQDGFFLEIPPKSTGREEFGRPLVEALARERGLVPAAAPTDPDRADPEWCDLLATLTVLTARSVGDAYARWVTPRGVDEVVLTGGGARNPALAEAIGEALSPLPLRPTETLGVDPDAREAVAFAVLAWAHVLGIPGNVPAATGASGSRILGSFAPAPGRTGP